ncbi:Hypothetical predicted protein [Octopus vulgaris]|uniref:C3H1-type domain-containing protein n=1 Tax=Octopus vulgaris TaxID=6645 RepID=A0AA36FIX0_OCTVU|nr:Hypothetical predicted protein [Octopus vulgaris]
METLGATGYQSYYQFSPSDYYDQPLYEDCVEYPVFDGTNIDYSPGAQGIDLYNGTLNSCNDYENGYEDYLRILNNNQLMDTYEHYENEQICAYADNPLEINHSQEEIFGEFNVPNSVESQRTTCDINYIISTYGQSFAFFCKICLERSEISKESSDNPHQCAGSIAHYWESTKVLQCITQSVMITIRKPFTVRKEASYSICTAGSFCTKNLCTYAHSEVERDVWRLERDEGIGQERLVEVCKAFQCRDPSDDNEQLDMSDIETEDLSDDADRQRRHVSNIHKDDSFGFSNAQNSRLTINNLKLHDKKLDTSNTLAFKSEDVLTNAATIHPIGRVVYYTLKPSCRNGENHRHPRFIPRENLPRRPPYSREDVTKVFEKNGHNNKTTRRSLAEKTTSDYNGNHGVCIGKNEIPGRVTLLRRPSDVTEKNENPVDILISNDTFATSEHQTPVSAENGGVDPNSLDWPQSSYSYCKSFSVPDSNKYLLDYMTIKDSVETRASDIECTRFRNSWLCATYLLDSSNDKQNREINGSCIGENKELCDRPAPKEETPDEESDIDEWKMLSRETFHEAFLGLNPAYYTKELADD